MAIRLAPSTSEIGLIFRKFAGVGGVHDKNWPDRGDIINRRRWNALEVAEAGFRIDVAQLQAQQLWLWGLQRRDNPLFGGSCSGIVPLLFYINGNCLDPVARIRMAAGVWAAFANPVAESSQAI